ncbi:MAG: UDP-3-O-(3-hydroxymyristoyl)glucosamine N-acyltransferase [Vulcanimicrobiota bacterium]
MNRSLSLDELVALVKGEPVGSFYGRISGTCAINEYVPGKVTFIKNAKYGSMLENLEGALVIVPHELINYAQSAPKNCYVVVQNIFEAMMDLQDFFYAESFKFEEEGISTSSNIHPSAFIGEGVYIGDYCYIGKNATIGKGSKLLHTVYVGDRVVLGENCLIDPQVTIYRDCSIGNRCQILSGTRIGVEGFRFEQNFEKKSVRKWLHTGKVIIGDDVYIAANSTIQRATYEDDATTIGDDVKIDSHVHVGHNCRVRNRTIIAGHTNICGSVSIGEDCWIGAGVNISMGLKIHNRAKVLISAVTVNDVPENELYSGFYARPHREWKAINKKWTLTIKD